MLLAAGLPPLIRHHKNSQPRRRKNPLPRPPRPMLRLKSTNRQPTAAMVSGLVVRESDESPVGGAEVRLVLGNAGINVGVHRTKTDERGQFSFEDVPAGTHRVIAVTEGLARANDACGPFRSRSPPERCLIR